MVANVYTRIAKASDELTHLALELKEMLSDGRIDAYELRRLPTLAEEIMDTGAHVADVEQDIDFAKQVLTLGRERTPNNALLAKSNRTKEYLQYRMSARSKRNASVETEAQVSPARK